MRQSIAVKWEEFFKRVDQLGKIFYRVDQHSSQAHSGKTLIVLIVNVALLFYLEYI